MRIARCYYGSKFFHVMVQGIRKERIFRQDYLKEKFVEYIKKGRKEHQISILAYCVMENHAHILVYTEDIRNLSKMMHYINTTYAHKYNKINKRCGYVFRDRYKCESVMTIAHLKNCIRYIHNNPVKAKICNNCSDYFYSSYKEYMTNEINTEIIEEYYIENKITKDNISKQELAKLIRILVNKYNISKLEIQKIFGISKYMTYKLLKYSCITTDKIL